MQDVFYSMVRLLGAYGSEKDPTEETTFLATSSKKYKQQDDQDEEKLRRPTPSTH